MVLNRRSLFLGALAIPFGVKVPDLIAEELSLPPPELKVGDKLVLTSHRRESVLYLEDLMYGFAPVTVISNDGKVVGTFRVIDARQEVSAPYNISMGWSDPSPRMLRSGPLERQLSLTLRGYLHEGE
jgi:hypothetical protein